nr:protein trichome birefringence-like 2 [Tanacetum cinerariifolium]
MRFVRESWSRIIAEYFCMPGEINRISRRYEVVERRGLANENIVTISQNLRNYSTSNHFGKCDIFDGRWIRDDTKPYYPPESCPYIDGVFNCHRYQRPYINFVKWRWQPFGCDTPSLNTTDFLERLKGKKMVFVGDSLNRNMRESLVWILRHSLECKNMAFGSNVDSINDLDGGNPLHMNPNESTSTCLIPFKLTGPENYRIWASATKLALQARNKYAFVDDSCVKSTYASSNVLSAQWDRCNAVVLTWIMNFVFVDVYIGLVYFVDAATV